MLNWTAYRNNQASTVLRMTPPLIPKWTAALDWLEGELDRRQVYPQYTDWGRSALQLTNENSSNSTFLERSNSARNLLAKAREVFPSTPPVDSHKQSAAGTKGSAATARGVVAATSSKSEQPTRPNAPLPTKSANPSDPNSVRSGVFPSPQTQQRSPTADEGEPDDETLEDQQLLGQSGEEGVEGEPTADDEAMDDEEADDEGDRGGPSEDEDDGPDAESYSGSHQLGTGDHRSPHISVDRPVSGSNGTHRAPPPYTEGNEDEATKHHPVPGHRIQTPANLGFGSITEQAQMPEVFVPSSAEDPQQVPGNEPASRPPSPSQSPAPGGRIESTNL